MAERFVALLRYARMAGADAMLYTCSAFGAEVETARRAVPLPTLQPNEAMLDEALAIGTRIGLVATSEPSLGSIGDELRTLARPGAWRFTSSRCSLPTRWRRSSAATRPRTTGGSPTWHAASRTGSTSCCSRSSRWRARAAVEAVVAPRVLTSPDSAVDALRSAIVAAHPSPRDPT